MENGECGQQLLYEFSDGNNSQQFTNEFGITLSPYDFSKGSNQKIKWTCSKCNNIWFGTVNSMTCSNRQWCRQCAIIRIQNKNIKNASKKESFRQWCEENNTELLKQWTGIFEDKNVRLSMDEVSPKSIIRVLWRCDKGHEWYASIHTRVIGHNCAQCTKNGTSYTEQFIYWALKEIYKDTETRCEVLRNKENHHGIEFDIAIPSLRLCIEYLATFWHKNRKDKDKLKRDIFNKYNVRLIEIVDDAENDNTEMIENNIIHVNMKQHNRKISV